MRVSSTLSAFVILASSLVNADLHTDGVCVDKVSGQNVYHEAATKAACTSYLNRNTGNKQWDQCPDCAMKVVGNLNVCHSDGWHIGGDELSYYCKMHGARGSLAS